MIQCESTFNEYELNCKSSLPKKKKEEILINIQLKYSKTKKQTFLRYPWSQRFLIITFIPFTIHEA